MRIVVNLEQGSFLSAMNEIKSRTLLLFYKNCEVDVVLLITRSNVITEWLLNFSNQEKKIFCLFLFK